MTVANIDWQDKIERRSNLRKDLEWLRQDAATTLYRLREYAIDKQYGVPHDMLEEVAELATTLLLGVAEIDPDWIEGTVRKEAGELWDRNGHYGCEPADFRP